MLNKSKTHIFISKSILIIFAFYSIFNFSFAQSLDKEKLNQELKQLEVEIESHKKVIDETKKKGSSLERDITILDTKIKKTETEIKLRDKSIQNLAYSISDKNKKILTLDQKLEREKLAMKTVLRDINFKSAQTSEALTFLSGDSISESVDALYGSNSLKKSLISSSDVVKQTKKVIIDVKQDLEDNKDEEESLKSQQVAKKQEIQEVKGEKKEVLSITKGEEKKYKEVLKNAEKKAAEIRTALFSFKDGSTVNFGNLYDYAKQASAASGVRTEFILAILEQESAFGSNVGQCYVSDEKGSLVSMKNSAAKGSMKPDSVPHFFNITKSVGRDTYKTRVSCALSYGYGGAMGMSQFMPATWVGYESKIKKSTGESIADPWNPRHSIAGTGFLLKDNGGAGGDYSGERNAACKYYSGSGCSKSSNAANYGNQVMNRINGIQNKIDILKNN